MLPDGLFCDSLSDHWDDSLQRSDAIVLNGNGSPTVTSCTQLSRLEVRQLFNMLGCLACTVFTCVEVLGTRERSGMSGLTKITKAFTESPEWA